MPDGEFFTSDGAFSGGTSARGGLVCLNYEPFLIADDEQSIFCAPVVEETPVYRKLFLCCLTGGVLLRAARGFTVTIRFNTGEKPSNRDGMSIFLVHPNGF